MFDMGRGERYVTEGRGGSAFAWVSLMGTTNKRTAGWVAGRPKTAKSSHEKKVTEAMMREAKGSSRYKELRKERAALRKQRGKEKRVQKLKRIA